MFDIKYFPPQAVTSNYLGGGYITSGGLKVNFTVWKNDKFSQGFSIGFATRKNAKNGEIINEVQFINREASDVAYNQISSQVLALLAGGSSAPASRPSQPVAQNASQPTQINSAAVANSMGTPF
jgi:hypothetical protein